VSERAFDTTFSRAVRMGPCANCGAPLDLPLVGTVIDCGYCRVQNQIAARPPRRPLRFRAYPLSAQQRLSLLRSQLDLSLDNPPEIRRLLDQRGATVVLRSEAVAAAYALWRDTSREVATTKDPALVRRLWILSLYLSNYYLDQGDRRRQRALYEAALDVLPDLRHRQEALCLLSSNAAICGDLVAAEEWLEECDPEADDLPADSAYRSARAHLATARRQWHRVFDFLGAELATFPIHDSQVLICAVLRANAHERLGNVDLALQQLEQSSMLPGSGAIGLIVRNREEWQLCATSLHGLALGVMKRGETAGVQRELLALGLLCLCAAGVSAAMIMGRRLDLLPGISQSSEAELVLAIMALASGAIAVLCLPLGFLDLVRARRQRWLYEHGVRAVGRVQKVEPINVWNRGFRVTLLHVDVYGVTDVPYSTSARVLVSDVDRAAFVQGASVPLRVNPTHPLEVGVDFQAGPGAKMTA
jgi:hypothetical protein